MAPLHFGIADENITYYLSIAMDWQIVDNPYK